MKIGTRFAIQFTLLVALILTIFSIALYYLLETQSKKEFSNYLKDRAEATASILIKEKNIDKRLLKILDRSTLSSLYAAEVLIFNDENKVTYSNTETDTVIYYSPELLAKIRKDKLLESEYKNKAVVGLMFTDENTQKDFLILAQSENIYGKQKLENIGYAMTIGLISAILLTIILAFVFSNQALKPIFRINQEISKITANNLNKKLSTGNNKDEIASLARNFNEMLSRLEKSFYLQKSFVSNASHELRTPLAAIKSEIQVALEKDRTPKEYQDILISLENDNSRLVKLTNGLLQLAKSEEGENTIKKENIRLDELLFSVQDEITHQSSDYIVEIDFESIPENEEMLTVKGNYELLKTMFLNLVENACKYSEDKKAFIKIKNNNTNCIINVIDHGMGIRAEDIDRIFEPFFRTSNASNIQGHGIGLSICKKIIENHKGRIVLKSNVGEGTVFSVILPHI